MGLQLTEARELMRGRNSALVYSFVVMIDEQSVPPSRPRPDVVVVECVADVQRFLGDDVDAVNVPRDLERLAE